MTLPTNTYPRGSIEYVTVALADVTGKDITDAGIEVAIHRGAPTTWLEAAWISGGSVRTVSPVAFNDDFPVNGRYTASVRVTDSPEIPILPVGTIVITS